MARRNAVETWLQHARDFARPGETTAKLMTHTHVEA
jgi:hypothetical protein